MDIFFAVMTMLLTIALMSAIFKIFRLENVIKTQQSKIDKYEMNDEYMTNLRNAYIKQYETTLGIKDNVNEE